MAGQVTTNVMREIQESKASWPPGPWHQEPDRVEFRHAGFPCLLVRNHMGAWCGYVAVPPGHAAHGKLYGAVDVEVHGGLTYSDQCCEPICHVAQPGEPDDVWWLGFDCAHCFDLVPSMMRFGRNQREVYRDLAYVRAETERIAEQLKSMAEGSRSSSAVRARGV